MKIIVTGGAGFIGSHIAERLLSEGHEVTIVDDFSSGVDYSPAGAAFKEVDVTRGMKLDSTDAVVHCAAYADLRHNWDSPEERMRIFRDNTIATLSLLEAMPTVPIVFLSSASVYGSARDFGHGIAKEDGAWEINANAETCESPYAASKLAGEALIAAYAHKRGTPWHVLRLVNVVGARVHRGVIVDFVKMMREKGAIHALDDGRQTKPWVHVADVTDAVSVCLGIGRKSHNRIEFTPGVADLAARAANALSALGGVSFELSPIVPSGVYNVTSRHLLSWWDIVDAMGIPRSYVAHETCDRGCIGDPHNLRVSGEKLAPYFVPRRDPRDGIKEALAHLGWRTDRVTHEEGMPR